VDPEVEVDPEIVDVLAVAPVEAVAVPGMVYALTTPAIPTAAIALTATPAVSRLSIRSAASRARILGSFALLLSMVFIVAQVAGSFLCAT
jgi:hypothetical protein